MTAEPGALLHDRYRLGPEIGRGGMAVVYRAHDGLLDRDVAVKVVRKTDLTAEDRQRLLQEARLAARLNHPHIVAVHDAGEIDGHPYIVMELVDGPSLFGHPPADLDETIAVAVQLCEALAHAHREGIVHRDLKPENILRAGPGVIKLTDFGLAQSVASRVTGEGAVAGTVFYLAPEQLQGLDLDGRADLYALGILLYEWVTGTLPFTSPETLGIITQHLYAAPVPPRARVPAVPPALDRLILRLLSKSPDDRPASALDVLDLLREPALMKAGGGEADVPLLERIGRGQMAGRETELAVARSLWTQAAAGQSQTLLVSGEAGVGKTRLVREIAALAEVTRGRVLQGWNYPQGVEPFGAFKQILRAAFDDLAPIVQSAPEYVAAALLSIAPEYHPHFPSIVLKTSVDTPEEQQRHFDGAVVLLSMLSEASPVLLVVEDAQWADSGTLRLFRHLVQQTRGRRVLFILTYRDVEPVQAPDLHDLLYAFRREKRAVALPLVRLDRAKTEDMLAALLGENVAPDLAEETFRVTEGNPFFVEEVCRSLAESGALVHAGGRWKTAGKGKLGIPVNVKVAITGRLRGLPSEAQEMLEAAAIRGRDFEVDVLQRALAWDPVSVVDALELAERAQIVETVPGPGGPHYAFTHNLIPATIVDDMRASRRRSLHARIAPALEMLRPGEFESLARHFHSAGDGAKAAAYWVKAGDRAHALYTLRETIDDYAAAAEIQQGAGEFEQAALTLMRLGLAYSEDFQFDRAQEAYAQAFDLWEKRGPLEQRAAPAESEVTLKFAMDEPLTLDPGLAGDDMTGFILGQLFEGLLEVDEASGVIPALAARWELSEDGKRYIFYLRHGRRWSDGSPLTAADFEYAWKRNLHLGPSMPAAILLNLLAGARACAEGRGPADEVGVRALDDRTLEVRLDRPAAFFPLLLTHAVTYPLPRHVLEGDRQPWTEIDPFVGNGPYRLAEWRRGERLTFERNPFYRGLARGNVARIEAPVTLHYDR
ncbi:MAG TPA: ABC transporter substrate-binding protein, partial [Anaerolineales bacterium]|nr:ABC transporter substrate-binding protein [Anaerolineales bacterium]